MFSYLHRSRARVMSISSEDFHDLPSPGFPASGEPRCAPVAARLLLSPIPICVVVVSLLRLEL